MGTAGDRYDEIGRSYLTTRREDPHIAAQILAALGPGSTLNVGAGSGNYEPRDRPVVAVEPSAQMLRHRTSERAPAVRSIAESLPFADKTFDTSMAVLTIHHWTDPAAGLREMARVSDRQVVFFFEQHVTHSFWALDYFPSALSLPTETAPPGEQFLRDHLDVIEVTPVLVPRDCVDGFGVAFWARPEAYLDPPSKPGRHGLRCCPIRTGRMGPLGSVPPSNPVTGIFSMADCGSKTSSTAATESQWRRLPGDSPVGPVAGGLRVSTIAV